MERNDESPPSKDYHEREGFGAAQSGREQATNTPTDGERPANAVAVKNRSIPAAGLNVFAIPLV